MNFFSVRIWVLFLSVVIPFKWCFYWPRLLPINDVDINRVESPGQLMKWCSSIICIVVAADGEKKNETKNKNKIQLKYLLLVLLLLLLLLLWLCYITCCDVYNISRHQFHALSIGWHRPHVLYVNQFESGFVWRASIYVFFPLLFDRYPLVLCAMNEYYRVTLYIDILVDSSSNQMCE